MWLTQAGCLIEQEKSGYVANVRDPWWALVGPGGRAWRSWMELGHAPWASEDGFANTMGFYEDEGKTM